MMPPADPPAGMSCRWNGSSWEYYRPPVKVIYTCSTCSNHRSEVWSKNEHGGWSCKIVCFHCVSR